MVRRTIHATMEILRKPNLVENHSWLSRRRNLWSLRTPGLVEIVGFSLLLMLFIPACTPFRLPTQDTPQVSALPTVTTGVTEASPASTQHPPIATHKPLDCLSKPGQIETHEISHTNLVAHLPLRVYLPPCYDRDTFATYPVLVLLHGLLGTDRQWEELGVAELADEMIRSGQSPPFIILMPWIRNYEDPQVAIIEALIPYASEQWRLAASHDLWAIGGISRGAGQVLQVALLNPETFGAIGLHSPAFLHPPDVLVRWMLDLDLAQRPELWFDIGASDSLLESASQLLELYQDSGIDVTAQINQGDHSYAYWTHHVRSYMLWYRSNWVAP